MKHLYTLISLMAALLLSNCATSNGPAGKANMSGPSVEERKAAIAAEPKGSHFIGRRYYVEKTRFWGFVRRPGQPWKNAKLVMMNEDRKHAPDRFSENGSGSRRYAHDSNYEYKLHGSFTGDTIYDPNSNQILPEFQLTGYEVLDKDPGWVFSPADRYNPKQVTLYP